MKKFSDIEQFRHVVKSVRMYFGSIGQEDKLPSHIFEGTIKLHGTNAAVQRHKNEFKCQSRKNWIDPSNDNYGFATWFEAQNKHPISELFDKISNNPNDKITIYGEWCGPGIQSRVGICNLPSKQWVIFGAYLNDEYVANFEELKVPELNIYNVMDAGRWVVHIDFNDPEASIEHFNRMTEEVEEQCPYAKLFGIEGIGEGIVWKCKSRPTDSSLWFKTKGSLHAAKKKNKHIATVDPIRVQNIQDCVDIVLTEERLNQGIEQTFKGEELNIKKLGKFMKWIHCDILKEESDTLKTNNLDWKDVSKHVSTKARQFFMNEYDKF